MNAIRKHQLIREQTTMFGVIWAYLMKRLSNGMCSSTAYPNCLRFDRRSRERKQDKTSEKARPVGKKIKENHVLATTICYTLVLNLFE